MGFGSSEVSHTRIRAVEGRHHLLGNHKSNDTEKTLRVFCSICPLIEGEIEDPVQVRSQLSIENILSRSGLHDYHIGWLATSRMSISKIFIFRF